MAGSTEGRAGNLPPANPVVALLDDTLIRKRGHRIAGTSWRRDPLGPHFGPWHLANTPALKLALSNAYFASLGLPELTAHG
jgi:hypothetical protein